MDGQHRDRAGVPSATSRASHVPQLNFVMSDDCGTPQLPQFPRQTPAGINLPRLDSKRKGHKNTPRSLPLAPSTAHCPSPSPSSMKSPTSYSFASASDPRSPQSFVSSLQTPASSVTVDSVCHSRASSIDSARTPNGLQTHHTFPGGTRQERRRRGLAASASVDLTTQHRHRRMDTADFSNWTRDLPLRHGPSPQPVYDSEHELEDDDLRKYREADSTPVARHARDYDVQMAQAVDEEDEEEEEECEVHAGITTVLFRGVPVVHEENILEGMPADADPSARTPRLSPTTPRENDNRTVWYDSDIEIEDSDEDPAQIAEGLARYVMEKEFGLDMTRSRPPSAIVEAVRVCLDDMSMIIVHHQRMAPASSSGVCEASGAGATGPGSQNTGSFRANSSFSSGLKRQASNNPDDEDDEFSSDKHTRDGRTPAYEKSGSRKRPRQNQTYPCPFRKRSPLRFNCRDWEFCCKAPFPNMALLKRHLKERHAQAPMTSLCPRCLREFPGPDDLFAHQRRPQACEVRSEDPPRPEDLAMSARVKTRLESRGPDKIMTWEELWIALFPHDEEIPDPDFEPVVELYEVAEEYHRSIPEMVVQLRSILLLQTYNSGWQRLAGDEVESFNEALENCLKEFFSRVSDKAQAEVTSSLQTISRRVPQPLADTPSPAARSYTNTPPMPSPAVGATRRILAPVLAPSPMRRAKIQPSTSSLNGSGSSAPSVRNSSSTTSGRGSFVESISSLNSVRGQLFRSRSSATSIVPSQLPTARLPEHTNLTQPPPAHLPQQQYDLQQPLVNAVDDPVRRLRPEKDSDVAIVRDSGFVDGVDAPPVGWEGQDFSAIGAGFQEVDLDLNAVNLDAVHLSTGGTGIDIGVSGDDWMTGMGIDMAKGMGVVQGKDPVEEFVNGEYLQGR